MNFKTDGEPKEQTLCCLRFNPTLETLNYIRGFYIHLDRDFPSELGKDLEDALKHREKTNNHSLERRKEIQKIVDEWLPEKIVTRKNGKNTGDHKFPVQTKTDLLTSILVADGFVAYGKKKTPEGKIITDTKHKKAIDSIPKQITPFIMRGLPEKSGAFVDSSGRIFKPAGFVEKTALSIGKFVFRNRANKNEMATHYAIGIGNVFRDAIGPKFYRFFSTADFRYANKAMEQAWEDTVGKSGIQRSRRIASSLVNHNPISLYLTPIIRLGLGSFLLASTLVNSSLYMASKKIAKLFGNDDWDPLNKNMKVRIEQKFGISFTGPSDDEINAAGLPKASLEKENSKPIQLSKIPESIITQVVEKPEPTYYPKLPLEKYFPELQLDR